MIRHDLLFKKLLMVFFYEFMELFFPATARVLDRDSIEFLNKELLTGASDNNRREADLVAKAKFHGQARYCIILTENQANPQEDFNERMFHYFALVFGEHRLPIFPVAVFSHTARKVETNKCTMDFPDGRVLDFCYRTVQLSKLNWRNFLRQDNPVAAALMSKMGMRKEDRPMVKLECLRMIARLKLNREKSRMISGFVDNYLRLNGEELLSFQRKLATVKDMKEQEAVLEMTTSWKEEGIALGREEGRILGQEQGRILGRKEEGQRLALRLLERRFGPVPADLSTRIKRLSLEGTEALAEALLDFKSAQDLKRWLQGKQAA